ncbi:MAG: SDR family oxidoreductase [Lactimicrobium sp.]|jgi:short-subunit dehydrogenase|uniref:SDR family oxidoreductase n=1 Tax=Lactimicrobium sp. TaxID=2563780 RepID=UPI002F35CE7E
MKQALVTGASHGIGRAIAMQLCKDGWEVWGIGRTFQQQTYPSSFHPIILDLLDDQNVLSCLDELDLDLSLLVNNAGCAYYGLHEFMKDSQIQQMVRLDLEEPMRLCRYYGRRLRENHGTIINVASVTALGASPHAAAYGAAKAGLLAFSRSLFEEERKHGMKVICLMPDLTETDLYRHADFQPGKENDCHLESEDIALAVHDLLAMRAEICPCEMVIRPQRNVICKKRS